MTLRPPKPSLRQRLDYLFSVEKRSDSKFAWLDTVIFILVYLIALVFVYWEFVPGHIGKGIYFTTGSVSGVLAALCVCYAESRYELGPFSGQWLWIFSGWAGGVLTWVLVAALH